MFIDILMFLVFIAVVGSVGYFLIYKRQGKKTTTPIITTPTPVVTPTPPPSSSSREYGTGLTHLRKDNNDIGLNPEGVQEFASKGKDSFID